MATWWRDPRRAGSRRDLGGCDADCPAPGAPAGPRPVLGGRGRDAGRGRRGGRCRGPGPGAAAAVRPADRRRCRRLRGLDRAHPLDSSARHPVRLRPDARRLGPAGRPGHQEHVHLGVGRRVRPGAADRVPAAVPVDRGSHCDTGRPSCLDALWRDADCRDERHARARLPALAAAGQRPGGVRDRRHRTGDLLGAEQGLRVHRDGRVRPVDPGDLRRSHPGARRDALAAGRDHRRPAGADLPGLPALRGRRAAGAARADLARLGGSGPVPVAPAGRRGHRVRGVVLVRRAVRLDAAHRRRRTGQRPLGVLRDRGPADGAAVPEPTVLG